ncbi:MAG: ketopantoate reductase family protein [Eubacterium sp.]|nr:ketopantoate reductase family protein [Eubacterium sp.]
MKVLVYGVGAIGSLLTHFLCKAGNDVTVVARSTYDELQNKGLVVVHHYQHKTTIDHPKVLREAPPGEKYDIVFSVMQAQQQLNILDALSKVNTRLLVLVGNNLEADRCESYIQKHAVTKRYVLFGFQNSMGHRENGTAVTGGLPVTELVISGLHSPANSKAISHVKKALKVKGYKVTEINDMYSYYLSHIAEIMPYCSMCYKVDYDLKKLSRKDIKKIVNASNECFDYLKSTGITPMPPKEDTYYKNGIKGYGMFVLYRIMSKTYLGKLCISDHCKNGIDEMNYITEKFNEYRESHPGKSMPIWDSLMKYIPNSASTK